MRGDSGWATVEGCCQHFWTRNPHRRSVLLPYGVMVRSPLRQLLWRIIIIIIIILFSQILDLLESEHFKQTSILTLLELKHCSSTWIQHRVIADSVYHVDGVKFLEVKELCLGCLRNQLFEVWSYSGNEERMFWYGHCVVDVDVVADNSSDPPGRSIENKGVALVSIPTEELPKVSPSLQIRGYLGWKFSEDL